MRDCYEKGLPNFRILLLAATPARSGLYRKELKSESFDSFENAAPGECVKSERKVP
jgi:hypothetical protein